MPRTYADSKSPFAIVNIPVRPLDSSINPWERQPGESSMWYERFQTYMLLPASKRNIQATLRAIYPDNPRAAPNGAGTGNWNRKAVEWSWEARAAAYDERLLQEEREELEAARKANRDRRIQLTAKIVDKLSDAVDQLDFTDLTVPEAVTAFKHLLNEWRTDYRDLPGDREASLKLQAQLAQRDQLAELARQGGTTVNINTFAGDAREQLAQRLEDIARRNLQKQAANAEGATDRDRDRDIIDSQPIRVLPSYLQRSGHNSNSTDNVGDVGDNTGDTDDTDAIDHETEEPTA